MEPSEWRRRMLYYNRTRTELSNERKYLGWLGVSLGMISLGFVVERVDLFLARASGAARVAVPVLRWAPLLIFGMGTLMIIIATWEFVADGRRIASGRDRRSVLRSALVWMTLVSLVAVAGLLLGAHPASRAALP
jgi:uncharacterized membrane protein YidH (DUF202 family)